MQLKVASYNIHKAVGTDGRRDPERILAVLREIDADIVALQEADRRFGRRESVLPARALAEHTPYRAVPLASRPDSIGWHGNALLLRRSLESVAAHVVTLPSLEPRGAVCVDVAIPTGRVRVVGMHLDLSGLRRRQQVRTVLEHVADQGAALPTVMMGDLNEWARYRGCLVEFQRHHWRVLAPGKSFPSPKPMATLDRIIVSPEWRVCESNVHQSALARLGSDHLPVCAVLQLHKD